MPWGPKHCNACVVVTPSGRFVAPSMFSSHGRTDGFGSSSVVVGWISMLSSSQKSVQAVSASVSSPEK